jgi:hypothetical protein
MFVVKTRTFSNRYCNPLEMISQSKQLTVQTCQIRGIKSSVMAIKKLASSHICIAATIFTPQTQLLTSISFITI